MSLSLRRALAAPPAWAVLALGALILSFRRAQALARPQFWAEDADFYRDALLRGWRTLAEPQAGYLHMALRAVAAVAAGLNPAYAPAVFVGAAFLGTLYVVSRALSKRCPLPRLGGAFALAVVLVPDTHEVLLNIVNLQWVLAAGLVLLLLSSDPKTISQAAHDGLAALILGLTGPFSILLAPLFAWRAWSRRTRASATLAGLVWACAGIQALLVLNDPEPHPAALGPVAYRLIPVIVARRIGSSLLLGVLRPQDTDLLLGALAGVATLAGIAFLALRRGPLKAERTLVGIVFAAALASSLLRVRGTLDNFFMEHSRARYLYLPQLMVLWLLLAAAASGRGRTARIATALCVWALAVNLGRLQEKALIDLHWERYAPLIRDGEPVVIPTNPRGWTLALPDRRAQTGPAPGSAAR